MDASVGPTVLSSTDDLRAVYRQPRGGAVNKVIHRLDHHCAEFLAKSPFMVLSTADADGVVDGSPKGGEPGFASVLDDGRVAWADSSGNNRLDSFENIVTNPHVGLLFMIPGLNETLRINGTAELSTDRELCERFTLGGEPAKVVVVVTPAEAYIHCAKALRRSSLWDTGSWLPEAQVPSAIEMLRDHAAIDAPVDVIAEGYEADTVATLWKPGGGNVEA